MVGLLQKTACQLNTALVREHRFLRSASHELRTPVAVLRANLDLLEKLPPENKAAGQKSLNRIRRAADNLGQLIETLMWINRSAESPPRSETFSLDALVQELVQENRYLLRGKQVTASIRNETGPVTVHLPMAAARIALANLIRNAFQYTQDGEVVIWVRDMSVTVRNQGVEDADPGAAEGGYGYGIGLDLVETISRKLKWSYEALNLSEGRKVVLSFMETTRSGG